MRTAVALLTLGFIVMLGAIAYALIAGDFFAEAGILLDSPWFHLSMIDLYTGFFLIGGWIVYRERSPLVALAWVVLILTLGNLISCLYALIAVLRANGDGRAFWLGHRAVVDETAASAH